MPLELKNISILATSILALIATTSEKIQAAVLSCNDNKGFPTTIISDLQKDTNLRFILYFEKKSCKESGWEKTWLDFSYPNDVKACPGDWGIIVKPSEKTPKTPCVQGFLKNNNVEFNFENTDKTEEIKNMSNSSSELNKEELEILQNLEKQYPEMLNILKAFKISTDGAPSWDKIKPNLTKEILNKISEIREPELLLIPPTTRHTKWDAVYNHNKQRLPEYTQSSFSRRYLDEDSMNNGEKEDPKEWKVEVVEGEKEIKHYTKNGKGLRAIEMEELSKRMYLDDIIDNVHSYLILVMKSLHIKNPIDEQSITSLNSKMRFLRKGDTGQAIGYIENDSVEVRPLPDICRNNKRHKNFKLRSCLNDDNTDSAADCSHPYYYGCEHIIRLRLSVKIPLK